MNQPLASIVIPLFNREALIADCIASCQAQTYSNIEIVVVDDCSTDNSVSVVKEMMKGDPRIRLYQNATNQKLGYTRNVGISHAKGELITFLDSDDLILPHKIETCVTALANSKADCVNSPVISKYYNRADEVTSIVPGNDPVKDYLSRKIIWKVIGPVWTRKCLDEIGWFVTGEEIFGSEDFEFHLRAILKKRRIIYLDEPLSIQVNLDPNVDMVKIRHPDKFESKARRKIFSRTLVVKNVWKADLPIRSKFRHTAAITYYLLALLKESFKRLSFGKFIALKVYLVKKLFLARPKR